METSTAAPADNPLLTRAPPDPTYTKPCPFRNFYPCPWRIRNRTARIRAGVRRKIDAEANTTVASRPLSVICVVARWGPPREVVVGRRQEERLQNPAARGLACGPTQEPAVADAFAEPPNKARANGGSETPYRCFPRSGRKTRKRGPGPPLENRCRPE